MRGLETTETEFYIFRRKDWDLVHQALSANCSGAMFDLWTIRSSFVLFPFILYGLAFHVCTKSYPVLSRRNLGTPPQVLRFKPVLKGVRYRSAVEVASSIPSIRWYICLETRLIDGIFAWKRDCLGNQWSKKWRSRLSEDELAEFLKKCKNTQNILLDRSYLLFEEYLQKKKNIFLYLETVPRNGPKFWKNLETFWMNNITVIYVTHYAIKCSLDYEVSLYLYSICSFVGFFRLLIGPRIYHQTAMNVIDSLQYPQLNK